MKRKWIFCLAVIVFLLSACEEKAEKDMPSQKPEQTVRYTQEDILTLPDEGMYHQDTLLVTDIERDMLGRPALYMVESGLDESSEPYAQVLQYSLTEKGEWDMNVLCAVALTKRVKKTGGRPFDLPYICRGDDGNLYALLQIGGKIEEKIENPYAPPKDDKDAGAAEYFLLRFDEGKDAFHEVKLQTDSSDEQEEGKASDKVSQFHVMENGSPFLVFGAGRAVSYNGENGMVVSTKTVTDRAFEKNVGFGEQEFIYYSSVNKLFQVMDKDTMETVAAFGAELEEGDRGKDWYYDTHTDEWQMYAFNLSGLYRIGEYGKKVSISRLSEDNSFSTQLADATIYDIMVDIEENVYVLIRKQGEESYAYQEQWDFGIIKFKAGGE